MFPVNLLLETSMSVNADANPSSEGRVPVIWFCEMSRVESDVNSPTSDGMGP